MPRYHLDRRWFPKFFEIELNLSENSYTTVEGGLRSASRNAKTRAFEDAATAKREYARTIASLLEKGYVHMGDMPPRVTERVAIIAPPNEELERAVAENRDSIDAWHVLGDWLQSQGDPRGDAIALSLNGEDHALEELIATYQRSWLGDLYETVEKRDYLHRPFAKVGFRHGLMDHYASSKHRDDPMSCEDKVRALVSLPAARVLHSLRLDIYNVPPNPDRTWLKLLNASALPMLRALDVEDLGAPQHDAARGVLHTLLDGFPELQKLFVHGGGFGRKALVHDALQSLTLVGDPNIPELVGDAKLPALERLALREYPLTDVEGLVRFPKLKHLELVGHLEGELLIPLVAKSALLSQLEAVSFASARLTPAAVDALLHHKEAFAHLQTLDLRNCSLEEDVVNEIQSAMAVSGEILTAHQNYDVN